jgi:hypothetical protein
MSYIKKEDGEKREFSVYSLNEPNFGHIRYVGITSRSLKERWWEHCKEKSNTHRCKWISSLRRKDMKPDIFLIKSGLTEKEAIDLEVYLIKYYRELGLKLTNGTGGGDGMFNATKEVREKIGNAHRGKKISEEQKECLRKINIGRKHTDEAKQKISKAHKGKIVSDLIRSNMSKAREGIVLSEEHKSKIRANALKLKGIKISEERRLKMIGRKQSDESRKKRSDKMIEIVKNRTDEYKKSFSERINKLTKEQFDKAFSEYKGGKSINSLSKEYGIKWMTMKKYLTIKLNNNELSFLR